MQHSQGVPIRLELGPRDIEKAQTVVVRRDTGTKTTLALDGACTHVGDLLEVIQCDMYSKAKELFERRLVQVTKWEEVVPTLDNKCVVVLPWCEDGACEDDIKARSKR
jgi:prolyl-tRNA synthetase